MEVYKNLSGESGIVAYEINQESITVQFRRGTQLYYLYTYASAGRENIENMKKLAIKGQGLNSYIMAHVKNDFASKW